MKLLKRIMCVTLAFVLMLGMVPSVLAASYTVNGVSLPLSGYASGVSHTNCWEFAQMVYKKLWNNTSFTSYRNTSDDMLRSVGDGSARTVTAANAQRFISQATLGAVIRLSPSSHLNQADGNGHSQILIQKDSNGFTTYESNVNSGKVRIKYWTWAEYAKSGSSGGWSTQYGTGATLYFKYIKWPSAQSFGEQAVGIDARYPTPFKAFTIEKKNIDCYNSVNGNIVGSIYPDDECTIQEIYTNGWCKLACPWPSDANGYKIVYTPISAFIDTSYMVSEHNILTIAAGYTRKDMENWYANIPEGTHFWRIGKTGPGGYTQIIYHEDGVGYRAMWITHPGDKIEGLSVGADFYAYIINSEQWRHVTNDKNNVSLRTQVSNESQFWHFVYQGSGYYKIYNCIDGEALDVEGALAESGTNVQVYPSNDSNAQLWMLCGLWNGEIAIEPKCSTCVLDVTGGAAGTGLLEGANMEIWTRNGGGAQKFHLWQGIDLTVTYDANGGTGVPTARTEQYLTTFALSTTKPIRTGYTFLGWAESASATSATYAAGAEFTIKGNTTMYAVWKKGCPDNHSYSYEVTKTPTTSATGTLTATCSKCSGTATVTLPKLNTTDYSYAVKTAATCTVSGTGRYTWKTTTYGTFTFDVAVPAKGHSYTNKVTAPTCTAQGYTTHTCSCGYSYKDTYTSAMGHSYSYKTTKTPTTSATGTLTGTCSKCKGTTTVTLPKLNTTDYSYAVKTAATCTAAGTGRYTWKTTTYGSFYFDVAISAKGHSYTTKVTAPTCTAQGYTTHTCSCGYSYKDTYTNATGHSYSYKVTKAPTTSATGTLTGTCSKCKGTTTVTLPKLNTTDYSYAVKTAATCTAAGTGRYTWKTTTYGSFYFDVAISAKGHSYTTKVTAPTCTAQGYTTHTCSCGYSYKDTYTNATGHSYSYKATKAPTTNSTGTLTGTCSKCKVTATITLPKFGTTEYSYRIEKAPTYSQTGIGRYTWKTTTYGTFSFDVTLNKLAVSGQIVVQNGKAAPSGIVTLTVELQNNPGIAYLAVTPEYDASVLKLVSVENGEIVKDFDHDTNFSWSAAENSTTNGVLMRLTFEVADNATKGDYSVGLKFREAYNYDEQDVVFSVESGVITVSDILYGDANGDGVVNGKDVLLLRKYMANYNYDTGASNVAVHSGGDANGDGIVNGKDVLLMRKYMANYDYDTGTSTIVLGPNQ